MAVTPPAQRGRLIATDIKAGRKELFSITKAAQKSMDALMVNAVNSGNFMAAASVRQKLYKKLGEEYVDLDAKTNAWVADRTNTVAKRWHALAVDDLPKGATGTFGAFSKKYLNDIIGKINPSTIDSQIAINARLGGMLSSDVFAFRTAVSDVIREGAITGMTKPEMSAAMIKRTKQISPMATFIDKGGRTWKADSYFAMLNRTLHTTVARETYTDTAAEAGFDLMEILGGASTGPADDPCHVWEGKVVSMSGETKGYPTYGDALAAGVFHPNCIHFLGVSTGLENLTDKARNRRIDKQ